MTVGRFSLALLLVLFPACKRSSRVTVLITPHLVTLDQIGAQDTLTARTLDAREQPVSGVAIQWRSQDPTVALVSEGVVTAAGDGTTQVWAVVGRDSAFVVVAVQLSHPPAPVARLEVAPTRISFDALNAVQLLSIRAQTPDTAAVTSCSSDDPELATVDTTYTVTSLAEGVTRIRCRLVDAEALVRVAIRQESVRAAIAGRGRTLRMGRDTLRLALARVDRLNSPLPPADARWRSLDTNVVWVDAVTGNATGRALGTARVVGAFEDLSDTTALRVIDPNPPRFAARAARPPARQGGRVGTAGGRQAGGAAAWAQAAARALQARLGARDIRDTDSVFRAPGSLSQQSARWTLSLFGEQAERRVDFGLGLETERTSGLLFGGELRIAPFRRFEARIRGFTGELAARTTGALDATVGESQVDLGINPFGWLWLHLGAAVRGYRDRFAAQQWRSLRTGFELRLPLSDSAMHAVLQTTLLPVVRVSGLASPDLGIITAGGLEYRAGRLAAAAFYGLERFDFPDVAGSRRREQFAGLRFRLGVQLGR